MKSEYQNLKKKVNEDIKLYLPTSIISDIMQDSDLNSSRSSIKSNKMEFFQHSDSYQYVNMNIYF